MSLWNRLLGRGGSRGGQRAGGLGDRAEAIAAEPKRSETVLRRDAPAVAIPLPAAALMQAARDGQPKMIGDYPVIRRLGAGTMGAVYLVRHPSWNVAVALKVPQPELISDEHNRHRITREAESWTELGLHPNITYCYYVQSVQDLLLVVIEYVDGGNLADWIAAGRTADLKTALDLAIQFCHGLEHAHGHGMIHRDIKPANVLITKEGQLKITDFGIAHTRAKDSDRSDQGAAAHPVPADGTVIGIGTEDYMAPEQFETGELDARADLFAFGVCLYEMLCGRRPYDGFAAGARQEAPEPAALRGDPTLPPALCALMKRCVDWAPQNRPGTAKEIREQLCEIYQEQFHEPSAYAELPQFSVAAAALNNRALSYLELGKSEEAERSWQAALQADPRHIEAVYNYGLHLWRTARLTDDALIQRLEEASADRPTDWLSKLLRAHVYLESGDGESAKRVLQEITENDVQREQVLAAKRTADEMIASFGEKRTLKGHTGSVTSVYLSADGFLALSGSVDKTLKLWNVQTGECLRTFTAHTGTVESVCLSADGCLILSGSVDKTLKLWNVQTGECLRTFTGHTGTVKSVCLSAGGRYALSGSWDKTLKLWDVATGQCLRTFTGHTKWVTSVCIGRDGRFALSGSYDHTLKLWDVANGQCLRSFTGHTIAVSSVCLSPDGRSALSGSWEDTLKLWDVATGQCVRSFTGHTFIVNSVSLSADGRRALSGSHDETIKLWDVATGQCLRSFVSDGIAISVCFSANGRYALSATGDKTLKLWTLPTKFPTAALQLSRGAASREAIEAGIRFQQALKDFGRALDKGDSRTAHRGLRVARAGDFRRHPDAFEAWSRLYARMRKVNLQEHWRKDLSSEPVSSCCFSADGRYALSGSWDKTLKLWDVRTGECLRTFTGHTGDVTSVHLSADGRYALSGSEGTIKLFDVGTGEGNTVKLWDVGTGECRRTFTGHIGVVCLSADGRYVLLRGTVKTLELWDVATGQCLRTFTGHTAGVASVFLSADARYALSGSRDKTLKLWNIANGQCVRTFTGHDSRVSSVCLSVDGRYALSGSWDKTLKLWNIAVGQCVRTFTGHTDHVVSVCLGADSRYALSEGNAGLKLWDVATGQCLRTFTGHPSALCLSADGRYVLSKGTDETLELWEVATGQCLRTLTGHTHSVRSLCLSADSRHALSGGDDGLKLWFFDWDLEETEPAAWDEGARPYLQVFLRAQQPYPTTLPRDRAPSEEEITAALTRSGEPVWTEEDFKRLLYTLGCAGYGWLRPESISQQLEAMRRRPETFDRTERSLVTRLPGIEPDQVVTLNAVQLIPLKVNPLVPQKPDQLLPLNNFRPFVPAIPPSDPVNRNVDV